ncbi:hypothetical protein LENED_006387 [Lentinula edodes]|uniref:Uncharacterized protein n=1 Tax=Lentinula edodes TaxID=5353 RepID=A0A1Q3EBV5_LENED|nr:hypothetical protein LENED_006387 [Lentinula edodes]
MSWITIEALSLSTFMGSVTTIGIRTRAFFVVHMNGLAIEPAVSFVDTPATWLNLRCLFSMSILRERASSALRR